MSDESVPAPNSPARIRVMLYEHILQLGAGHFDQRRTGEAALTLVDGVEQLDPFFGGYLPQLFIAFFNPAPKIPMPGLLT